MNFKGIIILSILLTVLAIGAVSASQDTSDNINGTSEDVEAVYEDNLLQIEYTECDSQASEETDEEVSDETLSICADNESIEKSETSKGVMNESEQYGESTNNGSHYGYWVNSVDMLNLNLTDLSAHGVTDIFLNFYAYTRYNQSTIESFIADANDECIKVHIWTQIFYRSGKWTLPINNGTVNQEYFDTKIDELKRYANTSGVSGIHFDYLRFSGSAKYNASAEQNPGGMEAISEFVNQATEALHEINPNITLSAAMMPEIESLQSLYGYDYDVISEKMDVIVPMVYTGNFRENSTWVKQTTQWFANNSKGAEVWTGLQGYAVNDVEEEHIVNSPHSQMSIEIKSSLEGGSNGALIFRFGACENLDFINLPIDENEFSTFNNLDYLISCSRYLVVLNQDFTFNATHDSPYVNGIGIHRNNLIIDGNNHIINGSSLARMFNVTGKNVTFKNIVFVSGNSDNGGALHITGSDVRIINCTFIDNKAAVDGGAVYIRAPNATVINSRFINNAAIYNAGLYMNSIGGKLIGSYFRNNIANISAGAVGWAKKENGLIDNCTFISNSAHNEGGGAIFWNQGLNGKIINSKFEDNYANFNGSAIFWSFGNNGIISNCSFKNNNASVSGGAMILKGENITIEDCEFMNNSAVYGGALFVLGSVDIDNTTFNDNLAEHGNEILIAGYGSVTLNNVTPNNTAPLTYIYPKLNVSNVVYGDIVKIMVEVFSNGRHIPVNCGNVTVAVNDKQYYGNITDGNAKIEIANLDAGSYVCYVDLDCGTNYTSSKQKADFEVIKQNASISAANKAYVINYGGKYSITVKDANGKPVVGEKVTFALNGKNIGSSTTNAKGIATITLTAKILKTAKAGKKNLVVKFNNANYNVAGKTVKITINKEKTKITAKKKTFRKDSKIKKYSIFLKNSKSKPIKKVKVTLKINGKTYAAKTNAKGKAVFKITKLTKKGKHVAKITFKGDKYYKSVIKKVKLTIK